ncbi:MAG TPA: bifunctional phosphopantothenoylcysteine decarboxylase/phosphopantothenate--cysteine ligase CoaBC [Pseudonocardiaceae bacterium]|nr:bifunctional phosphopantothenoylcysteine decarboxylase/phosphopantothenate--cysteine ligase CoaBC [Pseudonocardiaceae bacterium]
MNADAPAHSRVVLGVTGGIAAYKACELLRLLTESGHDVTVVPTAAALRFVGSPTWEALSGKPVSSDVFADVASVLHVRLGQQADLVIVAPATANVLAKAAHGLSDDLLTATLLTARCPVLFAPAMHTEMREPAATRDNVTTLRKRGAVVLEPASGRLTGADTGPGRLPEPAHIFETAVDVLRRGAAGQHLDLSNRSVVVTAGGTREFVDPVRYLGNRSSGKQGYALARTAASRGADVTLIAANVSLPDPTGVKVVRVESTLELRDAVHAAARGADAVVMAAAPADFRAASRTEHKIKKRPDGEGTTINLVQNPDILAELAQLRDSADSGKAPVLVGFAAETGDDEADVLEHAREKLASKGCDLLVVNDVSHGAVFGADDNAVVILQRAGGEVRMERTSKVSVAERIWDCIRRCWSEADSSDPHGIPTESGPAH